MSDLLSGYQSDAVISPCGLYRYRLSRTWDGRKMPLVWIMLNPSTADATKNDPTIRRCINFAKREDAGGIEVLNLFALRATDPTELRKARDPVGPHNDRWIKEVLRSHHRVIAAWGRRGSYLSRDYRVIANLRESGINIECLGEWPRHPLYVKGTQSFTPLGLWR